MLWPGHKFCPHVHYDLELKRYDLESTWCQNLGSRTTIMCSTIQIQLTIEMLWPVCKFWLHVLCNLDLGNMTMGQIITHPLTKDNNYVKNQIQYASAIKLWPGHKFWLQVHWRDLDLGYMTLGQGHNTPYGLNNKYVEYHIPIQGSIKKLQPGQIMNKQADHEMDGKTDGWTDKQTAWFQIPPNFVYWSYNKFTDIHLHCVLCEMWRSIFHVFD